MVQMADNLSSQVNLGCLSISECLSTCILRVTLVGRVMVGRQWLQLVVRVGKLLREGDH